MTTDHTPSPDDGDDGGAATRPLIAERLKRYLEAEAAYRRQDGDDPEIVHDVRVAARRLRAALEAAEGTIPRSRLKTLRRAVKRAGRALGAVRDTDVQLALLEAERASAAANEAPGIDRLVARLDRGRAAANEEARATLADVEIRATLAKAKRRLKDDGDTSKAKPGKSRRSRGTSPRQIAKQLDALLASAEASRELGTPEAIHNHRIAAKRLRYTIELYLPELGDPGNEAIATLREIQDALGELHDIDVLIDLTRDEVRAVADEESALALSGTPAPAKNPDRRALLAFLARVARERKERLAAFEARWEEMVGGGLEDRIRMLAGAGHDRAVAD